MSISSLARLTWKINFHAGFMIPSEMGCTVLVKNWYGLVLKMVWNLNHKKISEPDRYKSVQYDMGQFELVRPGLARFGSDSSLV